MIDRLWRFVAGSSSRRQVAANSGWLLFDRLTRALLSLLVGAWVARYLGPVAFGELAYVLALLALFQAACSLGLDGPVVRDVAQDRSHASAVLGSALRLRVVVGAVGWLTAVVAVVAMRPGDSVALAMVAIAGAALVFQPAEVVDLWLQSQSKSRISIPFRLTAYCAAALVKVSLIVAGAPLWVFAVSALADAALVAAALALAYTRQPSPTGWHWDRSRAMRLVRESWPLMLSAVSIGIYMRIDQIMLRELADERQLGLYSAVMPFSQAWHMVPMTLCASLLPKLAQLQRADPEHYRVRLQQLFTLMAWAGAAAAGLTALCAPWVVGLMLGPQFEDAIPVLQWHVLTNVFIFLGVAQSLTIVNDRSPRVALYKALVGAAVCLGANYLLIPHWGAIGSAWAAAAAQFFSVILSNLLVAPNTFHMQIKAFFPFYPVRR